MALKFRLFNCDHTFSLDKVEALIQRVAAKISCETKIEKTYFPLPRMDELCGELEKEGSHFEYAVFVVHAHESRLSINEANAGIGYAKVYRALQKATGDRVLIVIGGDDNYKDQGERDKSLLSRWAWRKISSQFTEDYVNGVKSFIFSWEEDHHPIHEEALEYYLDPTKKGTQFVPRPKPPPARVPEKEETKKVEKSKLSEVKSQVPLPMETKSILENKFPPERNEHRALPSQPETRAEGMTHPLQRENQKSAISGTPEVHILSFHSSKPSVDLVENVFKDVYKELAIPSNPKASADQHINIQDYIMKHKPEYLVLVSDFEYIQDMLHLDNQVQLYKKIVKSFSFGAKLVFIITVDKNYREGYLISDVVHIVFTTLNQDIPGSEQPIVMSWNTTPWYAHKDALVQLLSPYGNVQWATPQQYGATGKYDPIPSVPSGTQPERAPRGFYRASISYGRVVDVLKSEPRGWKPDEGDLNNMLMKHGSAKKATIEFWDKGDGCGLQCAVHRSETKLYKIAEGVATNKQSITVYSYHADEKTMDEVKNFVHHVGAHELLPCPSIEPLSLMHEIKCNNPHYVMFSADFDVLGNAHEVKKLMLEQGHNIKDIIENHVDQGVIIMLFGDKYYIKGEELASKEATQHVTNLTQGIVPADKLTVLTCQDKPYIVHQNWMKKTLNSKSAAQYASDKGYLRYKAIISYSKVTQVLECDPPDWKPDEAILNKVLFENKKEKKALLEIWVNKAGDISSITVATESKIKELKDTFSGYLGYLTSSFSKKKKDEKKSDTEYSV